MNQKEDGCTRIYVELVQFSYLVDLEVVFDDVDLATFCSIASLGHGSRGSAASNA